MRAYEREGIKPRPAASNLEIATREGLLGGRIPEALKEVYRIFDGIDLGAMPIRPNEMVRIWPLEELELSSVAGPFGQCVMFADYLLSSGEYGYVEKERIILLRGSLSQEIAPNMEEFFGKCLTKDRSLFGA